MKFNEYQAQNLQEAKIASLLFLMEDNLNEENLQEGMKEFLAKMGLQATKEDSLIDYFIGFTKNTGKIILAAIKGDLGEVKRLASLLKKEDVYTFIVKLDAVTLGLINKPLEIIDALTGWNLEPMVKSGVKVATNVLGDIWDYIKKIRTKINAGFDKSKSKILLRNLKRVEQNLPTI